MGDCGLTGRKIIVDTYGGSAHHGGGAFSGKDPSKVDRSAAYAGRYVAKKHRRRRPGGKCEIQVSYAIGGPSRPRSASTPSAHRQDRRGPAGRHRARPLRPAPHGLVKMLDLIRPIFRKTAAYGHFGREEPEFTWERTDKAEALRDAAGL